MAARLATSSTVLAPLAGAVVATTLLYTTHQLQSARADAVLASLAQSDNEVRGAVRRMGREAAEVERASLGLGGPGERDGQGGVPTRYRSARRLSVGEEIAERWNTHLFGTIDTISRIQWDIAVSRAFSRLRSVFADSGASSGEAGTGAGAAGAGNGGRLV